MTWVAVGVAAVGAVGGAASARNASRGQAAAAGQAAAMQGQANAQNQALNRPFLDAGQNALFELQGRLPQLTRGYDPKQLTSEPGYMFGLQQGQQALERSLAARGRGVSGAALRAASEFGTNYGTTKLNDAFSRQMQGNQQTYNQLMGLTQLGQSSANGMATSNQQFASAAGNNIIGAGNARAAGQIGATNALIGGLNQGVSAYNNRPQQAPVYDRRTTAGGGGGYWDTGNGFGATSGDGTHWLADGGAVPMGRDAIAAELDSVWGSAYADGGEVSGPVPGSDPGKSDTVNTQLSGGEHIFDAEIVSMLGDGNTEAGHKFLEQLKQEIRAQKRAAPADRPADALTKGNKRG